MLGFYCDSKNSSITTEKSLLTSLNVVFKSQIPTILTTLYFAKWSLPLCRKSRVLANGPSLPFGDVVYGCPLSINYVGKQGGEGQRDYISLCYGANLSTNREGVKYKQNPVNVIYGCPLIKNTSFYFLDIFSSTVFNITFLLFQLNQVRM